MLPGANRREERVGWDFKKAKAWIPVYEGESLSSVSTQRWREVKSCHWFKETKTQTIATPETWSVKNSKAIKRHFWDFVEKLNTDWILDILKIKLYLLQLGKSRRASFILKRYLFIFRQDLTMLPRLLKSPILLPQCPGSWIYKYEPTYWPKWPCSQEMSTELFEEKVCWYLVFIFKCLLTAKCFYRCIYTYVCVYEHVQKECMCYVEEINIMLPSETTWISVYYISTFSAQRFLLKS